MIADRFQTQRYERKYIITPSQALQIREFLRHYLEPDEYSAGRPDYLYPIHSIYLDSEQLTTYWATVHGEKSRFKLRLRFYDDNADAPVFFEIKRRVNECIIKQRAPVRKEAAALLVAGQYPVPEHLLSQKAGTLATVQKFCQLQHHLAAQPKLHVAYLREAWLPRNDDFVRVTIDRQVRGSVMRHVKFDTSMVEPFPALFDPHGAETVILELKYTHNFPEWFRDLVRLFNLTQVGAPKYCTCVMGAGVERLSAPGDWNSVLPGARRPKHF